MRPANEDLLTYAEPEDPRLRRAFIRGIERISGQRNLVRMYDRARGRSTHAPDGPRPERFFAEALRELEVEPLFPADKLAAIPRQGPLMLVANHPFGVVDGLALCELAMRARGDVKVIIHRTLFRDESLRGFMLPIDFGGGRDAAKRNIAVRDEAIAYLRGGGTIAVFPGGGISTAQGTFGPVTDLEWKLLPAKLVHIARATVVPVYFPGQNSRLFQWVSQFSQTLRLSLVIREVNNKRGRPLPVCVGDALPYSELSSYKDRRALMDYLRTKVYALGEGPTKLAG